MNQREEVKIITEKAVKKLGNINMPKVLVEIPKDTTHGDYATNISFDLAKVLKRSPNEVASLLKSQLEKNSIFKKVEVVGGFINFFLKDEIFNETIKAILKDKNFGKSNHLNGYKILIEYTDPNILKEFHIGHLMSNTIGESLSRIFEFNGGKIKRANYQSDVGLGIAKAVFGKIQQSDLAWQEAYVLGTKLYDENDQAKQEITQLNKKIFERTDKEINTIYDEGKKWSLEHFDKIYKKLGTKFDYYFFESQVADFGKQIVEKNIGKVFEKGENGAIIFKGENVGLHTRVFINSEGLPTYEAKELGLADIKHKKYKYDWSVIITANEMNEYFKVLLSAMSQIFPDLAKKTKHIGHGMMRLPEGKMSSRTGNVITAEFLIAQVGALVLQKIAQRDLSDTEKKEITEKVAIGALKYSILKQSIGSDIVYDAEKSVAFEGDSGPYLQYSLARALSVLRKAEIEKIKPSLKKVPAQIDSFVRQMHYFPEIIEKAGKELEPHIISLYLTELSREFNNYYANNKIVDKKNELSGYNVALVQAFSVIMKNGLWLLGIGWLEKM